MIETYSSHSSFVISCPPRMNASVAPLGSPLDKYGLCETIRPVDNVTSFLMMFISIG